MAVIVSCSVRTPARSSSERISSPRPYATLADRQGCKQTKIPPIRGWRRVAPPPSSRDATCGSAHAGCCQDGGGAPKYEAKCFTEDFRAGVEQLISHEVVRGHVTTFAYLRSRYAQKQVHFEATVLTMNTRAVTLFEGMANNAILIAHGVTEVGVLPEEYLQIGVLLALLLDDAKNRSSYLTWKEKAAQREVARIPRQEFLVTEKRADKLSGA
jgi:hypothetical protein